MIDPQRQTFRDFGRRWVSQQRAMFAGRLFGASEEGRMFTESRRLLKIPKFRGPLARMLCRVATILTRASEAAP